MDLACCMCVCVCFGFLGACWNLSKGDGGCFSSLTLRVRLTRQTAERDGLETWRGGVCVRAGTLRGEKISWDFILF